MSSFYRSFMSRHVLPSQSQWMLYLIHSVFVFPALVLPFCWVTFPLVGKWMMYTVFPLMLLTGFWMTYLTRKKPHIVPISDIFTSYGFSYFVWGFELLDLVPFVFRWLLHSIASIFLFYSLMRLYRTRSLLRLELGVLLTPLVLSHLFFWRQSTLMSFSIVSWTGTLFTLSHDKYWLFEDRLPPWKRILTQSLPLFVYLFSVNSS